MGVVESRAGEDGKDEKGRQRGRERGTENMLRRCFIFVPMDTAQKEHGGPLWGWAGSWQARALGLVPVPGESAFLPREVAWKRAFKCIQRSPPRPSLRPPPSHLPTPNS